jgi:hypothetical protein
VRSNDKLSGAEGVRLERPVRAVVAHGGLRAPALFDVASIPRKLLKLLFKLFVSHDGDGSCRLRFFKGFDPCLQAEILCLKARHLSLKLHHLFLERSNRKLRARVNRLEREMLLRLLQEVAFRAAQGGAK